jgi:hypothetical protein
LIAVALSATVSFATLILAETSGLSRTPENSAAIYAFETAAAQPLVRARANKGARKSWHLMKNVELTQLDRSAGYPQLSEDQGKWLTSKQRRHPTRCPNLKTARTGD